MEKAGKLVKLELAPEGVGRGGGELGHQYCLKFVTTQIDDKDDYEGGDYLWLVMAMIVSMTLIAMMMITMRTGW